MEKLKFVPHEFTNPVVPSKNYSFTYCERGQSFTPLWHDNELSKCFYYTISSIKLFFLSMLAISEILKMKRNGVVVEAKYRPKSVWFQLQLCCMFILTVEAPTRFAVDFGLIYHYTTGSSLLYVVIRTFALLVCFRLLVLERRMLLLTSSCKGHSKSILSIWSFLLLIEVVAIISWNGPNWWFVTRQSTDEVQFDLWIIRLTASLLLFLVGFWSPGRPRSEYWLHTNVDPDRDVENGVSSEPTNNVNSRTSSTWRGIKEKLKLIIPHVWPSGNLQLQLRVISCLVLLIAGRVVNPYVPIYSKKIVNSLSDGAEWKLVATQVSVYVGLRFLQGSTGGSGLLNGLRSFLWIRVQQFTSRNVQISLFDHLHSLSLRWHLSRKTGEVLRSIDRGTSSINNILQYVVFNILPTLLDILIAIVYLITAFNMWFGIIVLICLALYLAATIIITEWRTKFRRDTNLKDNKSRQLAIDSLLNFETVKYYNAESYEVGRFTDCILDYQDSEYKTVFSLVFLNLSQTFIINMGLFAGSLLCAKYVLDDYFQVGDYVLFGTYIIQLYTPLGYFGTYYRMIQSSFVDMENMFDLFKEGTEVVDRDDADELPLGMGKVEFEDVYFHYKSDRQILNGISFTVEPGKTVALVGPSGSGKSTIIRLLLRFYDITSGCIKIDGVDISSVTQKSLRSVLGVVPQDTVLFNTDIIGNIRYGRVTASDEEIYEAARAADIHDRIISMPDGYNTKVGERGLKLSGGEKQRVAIARSLLKSPNIVLLDEATSALDTTTERNIQASISRVFADRTTVVVAHRLSTIVNADQILVLNEGEIIERGSHDELLEYGGLYANLWNEQLNEGGSSGQQEEDGKGDNK